MPAVALAAVAVADDEGDNDEDAAVSSPELLLLTTDRPLGGNFLLWQALGLDDADRRAEGDDVASTFAGPGRRAGGKLSTDRANILCGSKCAPFSDLMESG